MLTIDHFKCLIVLGLQYKVTHVMGWLASRQHSALNVLPQIVPLITRPTVIPLKPRYLVAESIAEELAECLVTCVEVYSRHLLILVDLVTVVPQSSMDLESARVEALVMNSSKGMLPWSPLPLVRTLTAFASASLSPMMRT